MRDYARVRPTFWTGDTGKSLKKLGNDARLLALYLVTCPASNMAGFYYLPISLITHELGITEEGASKGLRSLEQAGFCFYDYTLDLVFVVEMAKHQIAESLTSKDKRSKGVANEVKDFRKSFLYEKFYQRYAKAFSLEAYLVPPASVMVQEAPCQAPSKPLRSQEQEQEQEQEQDQEQNIPGSPFSGDPNSLPEPPLDADGYPEGSAAQAAHHDQLLNAGPDELTDAGRAARARLESPGAPANGALFAGAEPLPPSKIREFRWNDDQVDAIYAAYPVKEKPKDAKVKIRLALEEVAKRMDIEDPYQWLLDKVKKYAASPRGRSKWAKHPTTWFNQHCFFEPEDRWQQTYDRPNSGGWNREALTAEASRRIGQSLDNGGRF